MDCQASPTPSATLGSLWHGREGQAAGLCVQCIKICTRTTATTQYFAFALAASQEKGTLYPRWLSSLCREGGIMKQAQIPITFATTDSPTHAWHLSLAWTSSDGGERLQGGCGRIIAMMRRMMALFLGSAKSGLARARIYIPNACTGILATIGDTTFPAMRGDMG